MNVSMCLTSVLCLRTLRWKESPSRWKIVHVYVRILAIRIRKLSVSLRNGSERIGVSTCIHCTLLCACCAGFFVFVWLETLQVLGCQWDHALIIGALWYSLATAVVACLVAHALVSVLVPIVSCSLYRHGQGSDLYSSTVYLVSFPPCVFISHSLLLVFLALCRYQVLNWAGGVICYYISPYDHHEYHY